ncbi:hypothetical protein E2C01_011545 [Portunus trituberculatus]|uniref:Uncharacterized protein n=1 Tax=Portunus trituberculatus TaxID=210409 RepID=A0A5B7DBM2_PORTR|nr:hypothetical protein [Portunus trituberculatus]
MCPYTEEVKVAKDSVLMEVSPQRSLIKENGDYKASQHRFSVIEPPHLSPSALTASLIPPPMVSPLPTRRPSHVKLHLSVSSFKRLDRIFRVAERWRSLADVGGAAVVGGGTRCFVMAPFRCFAPTDAPCASLLLPLLPFLFPSHLYPFSRQSVSPLLAPALHLPFIGIRESFSPSFLTRRGGGSCGCCRKLPLPDTAGQQDFPAVNQVWAEGVPLADRSPLPCPARISCSAVTKGGSATVANVSASERRETVLPYRSGGGGASAEHQCTVCSVLAWLWLQQLRKLCVVAGWLEVVDRSTSQAEVTLVTSEWHCEFERQLTGGGGRRRRCGWWWLQCCQRWIRGVVVAGGPDHNAWQESNSCASATRHRHVLHSRHVCCGLDEGWVKGVP